MINCCLGDAFGVLFFHLLSNVIKCGALLLIHTYLKLLDRVVSGASSLSVHRCY